MAIWLEICCHFLVLSFRRPCLTAQDDGVSLKLVICSAVVIFDDPPMYHSCVAGSTTWSSEFEKKHPFYGCCFIWVLSSEGCKKILTEHWVVKCAPVCLSCSIRVLKLKKKKKKAARLKSLDPAFHTDWEETLIKPMSQSETCTEEPVLNTSF